MIGATMLYLFFDLAFFGIFSVILNDFFFNPFENYKTWDILNWFGVWTITILYWILFLPVSIMLVIYKLFTIGRR